MKIQLFLNKKSISSLTALFLLIHFSIFSQDDKSLLVEIINMAKEKSVNSPKIDWLKAENQVLNVFNKEGTDSLKLNKGMQALLEILDDSHSVYLSPSKKVIRYSGLKCPKDSIEKNPKLDRIGYLHIPAFFGSKEEARKFANNIQEKIKKQDTKNIKGWIIDLRNNSGGNMWPMLGGLMPFFQNINALGSSRSYDGTHSKWVLKNNSLFIDSIMAYKMKNSYKLKNNNKPIAILINQNTASSGEAVTIAFKSIKNSIIIGKSTCGLSTSNEQISLKNGAYLLLTTGAMCDVNGTIYTSGIKPDLLIEDTNKTLSVAKKWILEN